MQKSALHSKRELFLKNKSPCTDSETESTTTVYPSPLKNDNTYAKRQMEKEKAEVTDNKFKKIDGNGTVPEKKVKQLDGYVGFADLPNQIYRKAVKKGFDFTLMVVGESGLGKSTLINSMFLADIYSKDYPGPSQRIKKTIQVETTTGILKENSVNLFLTIVDTPGFGDAIDNSNCWQPIIEYIESRNEEYFNEEFRVNRQKSATDRRVHCCLYFIAPSGHGLKPLDVEFMQKLHDKVNIIPIIAKADTMTLDECTHFKKQILNEITQHKIKIYEFPDSQNGDGTNIVNQLKDRVPMAVVGSNTVVQVEGKKIRGREYPWGLVDIENLEHCDFIALRDMVIRTHLHDLKDVTNNVHYENYRFKKLTSLYLDPKQCFSNKNPFVQMEEEKQTHNMNLKKMEVEMEQAFQKKYHDKKQKLLDYQTDLEKQYEQKRKILELQIKEFEEKRQALEEEITAWEQANNVRLEELRRSSIERETTGSKEKKSKKKSLF